MLNNVLLRARGSTNEALTRHPVADELLAVIELMVEQSYADLLVGEVRAGIPLLLIAVLVVSVLAYTDRAK